MTKIEYSKRNDSGQYYLSINGLDDSCGYISEIKEVKQLNSAIVATWRNIDKIVLIDEVRLIDANNDKVVGLGVLPYSVALEPGDSLTVTFLRSIKIMPNGVELKP